jgi:Fe2+ or Zn2+ uptake regulation protein
MITPRMVMEVEKYARTLRENNLKVTPQRLEVLKFLDENRIHPTADDIYRALKKTNPSLSKTTIYNVLDVLREHGLIDVLTISGTEAKYDLKTTDHHHFLCRSCGRVFDTDVKGLCMDCMTDQGHKVEEFHGYHKGTCKDCSKRVGG